MLLYKYMANNEVYLNAHGIVEFVVRGDQTPASINRMADDADILMQQQRTAGKPAVMLDNLIEMGKVSYAGRRAVVQRAKDIDYDKLAFVINDAVIRLAAGLIVRAIGKGDKVRYFASYDDAIKWLTSKS